MPLWPSPHAGAAVTPRGSAAAEWHAGVQVAPSSPQHPRSHKHKELHSGEEGRKEGRAGWQAGRGLAIWVASHSGRGQRPPARGGAGAGGCPSRLRPKPAVARAPVLRASLHRPCATSARVGPAGRRGRRRAHYQHAPRGLCVCVCV